MTNLMMITGYAVLLSTLASRHAYTISSSIRRFLDAVTFPHPIQPREPVILSRMAA